MKRLTLILTLALSLALLALASSGCGTTEVTVNDNRATTTSTPAAPAAPAAEKPAASSAVPAGAGITGVASCDEYLTQIGKCMDSKNVPEAAKAAYRQSLETYRTSWHAAAATAQGKAGLETQCKAALDSAKGFLATCK